jgi:hypothetical protein
MISGCRSFILGVTDYFRFPEQRASWGGPFNGQSGRQELFRGLINAVAPVAIIETGTYRGTTTELMAESGVPIYSVEGLARNYGFSRARLWRTKDVHLYRGDSRKFLRQLFAGKLRSLRGRTVFAYLDAHWDADLPLREELEIIFDHCPATVVMIDDFRVPNDPGYQFDDYGQGKVLELVYIEPILSAYDLEAFYPSTPSSEETGAKTGCVVLANKEIHGESLRDLPLLRRSTEKSNACQSPLCPDRNTLSPAGTLPSLTADDRLSPQIRSERLDHGR